MDDGTWVAGTWIALGSLAGSAIALYFAWRADQRATAAQTLARAQDERDRARFDREAADARRRELEQVRAAVLELRAAAATAGRGDRSVESGVATLSALVAMAPVPLPQTELMTRPGLAADKIVDQSESALVELRDAFAAL